MRITSLHAENVHGYLPINIEFSEDLTFLTGLNGSGKTSALRLLMALLTPNLEELASIQFSTATVRVSQDGSDDMSVTAKKNPEGILIEVSSISEVLSITSSELELYMDLKRRDETRSPLLEKLRQNEIFKTIESSSTPMFLGLDRRFYAPGMTAHGVSEQRRRELLVPRQIMEEQGLRSEGVSALLQVNWLVVTRMQEVRAQQERLDDTLRNRFFAKAFEYKPSEIMAGPTRLPSRTQIEQYRNQLATIASAAEVRIPVPEIQKALTHFFEQMGKLVTAIEHGPRVQTSRGPVVRKKRTEPHREQVHEAPIPDKNFLEWIINKPQADRVVEHLKLLGDYIEQRNALREPINRFLSLVNGFFAQTKKLVSVSQTGHLQVSVGNPDDLRPITALSSGEKQLLMMLAHLSLNPNLVGSGVFIVDEPELSLHIDWQEKFVEAIREANPKVQMILATHSPAIILDRTDACRAL
jgi:predicted ATPase